jgi:hypothetical protein
MSIREAREVRDDETTDNKRLQMMSSKREEV